jgi:SAM-dependent methyltransferase
MEKAAYAVEAAVEAEHWWYEGRRALFARVIRALDLPSEAAVVDVGCGTGASLRMLNGMGFDNVRGIDASDEAIAWCAAKGLSPVEKGDACALPLADGSCDLVLATDVIEHLDDDQKAVSEFLRSLRCGGHALITVPTFPSLWGVQDQIAHHRRRYRLGPLRDLIESVGFEVKQAFYFNFVLFPAIWAARRVINLANLELASETEINTRWLNRVLRATFLADVALAPAIRPPFGVSALVLARRPSR